MLRLRRDGRVCIALKLFLLLLLPLGSIVSWAGGKEEGVVPHQHAAVPLDPIGYTFCYCYLKDGRAEPSESAINQRNGNKRETDSIPG